MATGARGARRLVAGFPVNCIELPPVVKLGPGRYAPEDPALAGQDVVALRSELLADAVHRLRPDLLLVDRHPRGLLGELDDALSAFETCSPRGQAVLGLRDILDEPAAVAAEWDGYRLAETIRRRYPTVLCYGDRSVYDIAAEYDFDDEVAGRIRYTGYLTDGPLATDPLGVRWRHGIRGRLAVCTLGGGKDAAAVAMAFLDAMMLMKGGGWRGVLITGPYMPASDVERLRAHPVGDAVKLVPVAEDVPSYLSAADAVLCMGGYNTTCEVLSLAAPAVLVPRIRPRLEQMMRAERLAARGLLDWIHPESLTPALVATALERVARRRRGGVAGNLDAISHRGVSLAAWMLTELLPASAFEAGAFPVLAANPWGADG